MDGAELRLQRRDRCNSEDHVPLTSRPSQDTTTETAKEAVLLVALRKMEVTCSAAGDPLAGTEVNDASWNICGREKSNTNLSLTGWARFQEQTSSNN